MSKATEWRMCCANCKFFKFEAGRRHPMGSDDERPWGHCCRYPKWTTQGQPNDHWCGEWKEWTSVYNTQNPRP